MLFELKKAESGFYEIQLQIHGLLSGKSITLHSPVFLLHVASPEADILILNVFGKHYDTVSSDLLNLNQAIWKKMQGPENNLILRPADMMWEIHITTEKAMEEDYGGESEIYKTGIPIEESVFDMTNVIANITGDNIWRDILPVQMDRKIKIRET